MKNIMVELILRIELVKRVLRRDITLAVRNETFTSFAVETSLRPSCSITKIKHDVIRQTANASLLLFHQILK